MATPQTVDQDFAAVLLGHDKGRAHTEASKKLTELVEAVIELQKNGSVTVSVKVEPVKDMPNAVRLTTTVKSTVPKEVSKSVWYTDEKATLHRNDPRQHSMFGEEELIRTDEPRVPAPVRVTPPAEKKDSTDD